MIWKLATLEPRVYTIREAKNVYGLGYASALVPASLRVCRESRCITTNLYSRENFGVGTYTYFSKNDFIYLRCDKTTNCLSGGTFCCTVLCTSSFGVFYGPDSISRYIYEVLPGTRPFYDLSIKFEDRSALKEILLLDSNSAKPPKESMLSDFREVTTPFDWQQGRSLLQCWKDDIMKYPKRKVPDSLMRIARVEYVKS